MDFCPRILTVFERVGGKEKGGGEGGKRKKGEELPRGCRRRTKEEEGKAICLSHVKTSLTVLLVQQRRKGGDTRSSFSDSPSSSKSGEAKPKTYFDNGKKMERLPPFTLLGAGDSKQISFWRRRRPESLKKSPGNPSWSSAAPYSSSFSPRFPPQKKIRSRFFFL